MLSFYFLMRVRIRILKAASQSFFHCIICSVVDPHRSALILLSCIRICIGNLDPDPGAWKLTKKNKQINLVSCPSKKVFASSYICFLIYYLLKYPHPDGSAILGSLDPDPHWVKKLDPDPHRNQRGSTTLVVVSMKIGQKRDIWFVQLCVLIIIDIIFNGLVPG